MEHEEQSTAATDEPVRPLPPRETCAEALAWGFAMSLIGLVIGGIGTAVYLGEHAYAYGDGPITAMVIGFVLLAWGFSALVVGIYRAGSILDRLGRALPEQR